MEFSKGRMAALRVFYYLIILAILIVAKAEFGFSDQILMVLALAALAVVAASYPLQLKLIGTVAYRRKELGPESMVGLEGTAIEDVSQSGSVKVRGEIWKARSNSGKIAKGQEIVVVSVEDNLQLVVRAQSTAAANGPESHVS
jgi:membrane-bound ClpP family serine protease